MFECGKRGVLTSSQIPSNNDNNNNEILIKREPLVYTRAQCIVLDAIYVEKSSS